MLAMATVPALDTADHRLPGPLGESIVVTFLGVLGIDSQNQAFYDPSNYTSHLSGLVKMTQLLVIQESVYVTKPGLYQPNAILVSKMVVRNTDGLVVSQFRMIDLGPDGGSDFAMIFYPNGLEKHHLLELKFLQELRTFSRAPSPERLRFRPNLPELLARHSNSKSKLQWVTSEGCSRKLPDEKGWKKGGIAFHNPV